MPRAKMPSMLATEFPILADQREKISALNEVIKSADYRESLAAALGLAALPTDLVDRISELCYAYILTEAGSPGTTVGSAQLALTRIIVALEKAIGSGVPAHRNKATRIMRSLTDCRSEIAGEIRARLDAFGPNPFPEPVLAEAKSLLSWVKRLKRVDAKSESFREFCGRLGLLFAESTKFDFKDRQDFLAKRREFALEVLRLGVKAEHDYESHSDRLDELLSAGVAGGQTTAPDPA